MAVSVTSLGFLADTSNANSYSTGSITPTPGKLYLVSAYGTGSTGVDGRPSGVTGWGLTWNYVGGTTATSQTRDIGIWWAVGTPTAGALTIAYSAAMAGCTWNVAEASGADMVNPIVQFDVARISGTTSIPVANAPFPNPVNPANGGYSMVGVVAADTPAPGAGWTALASGQRATPADGALAMWAASCPQDTNASWTVSANSFFNSIEIKAASSVITPSGPVGQAPTLTAPTVSGRLAVAPSGPVGTAPSSSAPTVTGRLAVAPTGPVGAAPSSTAPTVTLGPPQITPSGPVGQAPTLANPTVTPGPVTVTPDVVGAAPSLASPDVTHRLTVSPPLLTEAGSLYAPVVTAGPITVTPDTVGSPAIALAPRIRGDEIVFAYTTSSEWDPRAPKKWTGSTWVTAPVHALD